MSKVRFHISVSLDGYVAGPSPSEAEPLGQGGMRLHDWVFGLAAWRAAHGLGGGQTNASSPVVEETQADVGAILMGRNMFGGGPGPWGADPWKGWWGDEPPFHAPVFVLTNHARDPLPMRGGTTFTFVTGGIEPALEQARRAAGDKDVVIAGGAAVIQQYLAAGAVDEFEIHLVPVLLGGGTRLLDNLDPEISLEPVRTIEAPGVTHLKYRVGR